MKKSNAQAELLSQPAGAPRPSPAFCYFFLFIHRLQAQAERHSNDGLPRTSRPRTKVFEQNAQADLVPLRDHSAIFFYLFIDYKHKQNDLAGPPIFTYLTHIFFIYS